MPFSPVAVMPHTVQVKSCFCFLLHAAAEIVDSAAMTWELSRLAGSRAAADAFGFEPTCEKTKTRLSKHFL
jgi:hypothetical protein